MVARRRLVAVHAVFLIAFLGLAVAFAQQFLKPHGCAIANVKRLTSDFSMRTDIDMTELIFEGTVEAAEIPAFRADPGDARIYRFRITKLWKGWNGEPSGDTVEVMAGAGPFWRRTYQTGKNYLVFAGHWADPSLTCNNIGGCGYDNVDKKAMAGRYVTSPDSCASQGLPRLLPRAQVIEKLQKWEKANGGAFGRRPLDAGRKAN